MSRVRTRHNKYFLLNQIGKFKTMLSEEIEIYESMRNELELNHLGKWIVIHDRELRGIYDSFEDAGQDAIEKFGRGPYLIRRVGIAPFVLPASVLYRPVVDDANG